MAEPLMPETTEQSEPYVFTLDNYNFTDPTATEMSLSK
jgi:hypothetical protein